MTWGSAAVIAVGTELVLDARDDTNGHAIASELMALGIAATLRMQVPDDESEIARALKHAAEQFPIVIVTGGLGPTVDDVTREAACAAFALTLESDDTVCQLLVRRYVERGRVPPEGVMRQALVPRGAIVLANNAGTAPGLLLNRPAGHQVFLLPGVPREMSRMLREQVVPLLRRAVAKSPDAPVARRTFKTAGLTEMEVQNRIGDLFDPNSGGSSARLTLLASAGEVSVIIRDQREGVADRQMTESLRRLGPAVFTEDLSVGLEEIVGRLLAESGQTLACAESCTGGMLGEFITRVPGSSAWFRQGWIVYANEAKISALGIDPSALARHGAVSEEVASGMALAARRLADSSLGVSITGIAGPEGGSEQKPVGMVFVGLAGPAECRVTRHNFGGDRETVRLLATRTALNRVRLHLQGVGA